MVMLAFVFLKYHIALNSDSVVTFISIVQKSPPSLPEGGKWSL